MSRHAVLISAAGGETPGKGSGGWASWLGRLLGQIRLHAIEAHQATGGPPRVAKRRRWFAPLLIAPGNLYLRLLRSGVRVLPRAEWQARERAVYRALHGVELETGPRGRLIFPRWPGVVLAEHARSRLDPMPARVGALIAASEALRSLHRNGPQGTNGVPGCLSHGDATLRNVMFDPRTGAARWFDFDMAHHPSRTLGWCRGDDLRALVYSAVESFADVPVAQLLDALRAGYSDPAPWDELRDRLARGDLHRSPLHFAQACLSPGRRRELESLLRAW